ncbi:MAG: TPR end-of-group domain-containing protein, partial [Chthoniobacterales bacterium]
ARPATLQTVTHPLEIARNPSFSGPFAQDPDIVELRLHIQMQGERWNDALISAEELLRITPDAVPAFIHGAFALHEMGRTSEARDLLLKGPPVLKNDPTFHYNIGCYEAVLGNKEAALQSLQLSFALDETYRDFAKGDPDLKLLHEELDR